MAPENKKNQGRPTKQMLQTLSRQELEEQTEFLAHCLGRLMDVSEHTISDIEQSKLDLDTKFPSYVALKEETRTINILLDEEEDNVSAKFKRSNWEANN